MRNIIALALLMALSGCIVAGVQSRPVINANGERVTQIRPCLYFVICTPWQDPNNQTAYTAPDKGQKLAKSND